MGCETGFEHRNHLSGVCRQGVSQTIVSETDVEWSPSVAAVFRRSVRSWRMSTLATVSRACGASLT